jgi:hypothetical protein
LSNKISFIGNHVSPAALFAQILEREGLETVVVLARVNGCWETTWATGVTTAGLAMAALKLLDDAQCYLYDQKRPGWSAPEDDEAG